MSFYVKQRSYQGVVGLLRRFGLGEQRPVDDIRQAALQTAQGFPAGLALGLLAGQVGARSRVVAGLGERGEVQRPVEPAVAAPVQPVPIGAPRRHRDRGGAVGRGKVVAGRKPVDVADLAQDAGRQQGADPDDLDQPGPGGGDQLGELGRARGGLLVELPEPYDAALGQRRAN